MPPAWLVMACVAASAALAGIVIVARPARSEQAVYAKRIAGTMALSLALILAIFAWGLQRIGAG
jgi:hypothetical protein